MFLDAIHMLVCFVVTRSCKPTCIICIICSILDMGCRSQLGLKAPVSISCLGSPLPFSIAVPSDRPMAAKCPWIIRHGLTRRVGSWLVHKFHSQSVNLTSKTVYFLNSCDTLLFHWQGSECDQAFNWIQAVVLNIPDMCNPVWDTLGFLGTYFAIVFSARSVTVLIVWNAMS